MMLSDMPDGAILIAWAMGRFVKVAQHWRESQQDLQLVMWRCELHKRVE